ncbi:MAG TPA: septum formation initiator family protein [Candidatus Tidjanibacter gallistercoris]|nr:septum formation initiator family protein [Candidatus Tidjanibacter gallistercoris]
MKDFWQKYRIWVIITIAFLLIITVFSKNTVIEAMAIRRRIKTMQQEQQYYREKAREDSTFLENLKQDWFLEKYARETFYMKARGEEIYLLEE